MSGTPKVGRGAQLQDSVDAGANYNKIGGIVSFDPDFNVDDLESTDMDSNGFKEHLLGDMQGTVDVDLRFEEDDTNQGVLFDAFVNRSRWLYRILPEVASGKRRMTGTASVLKLPLHIHENEIEGLKASLKYTGTITFDTQP